MTPHLLMKKIFDANLQILYSPIFRRALPVRGELAGGLTPAFFLQTKKGHGFSRFQRQTERRLLCLPVLRTDFRPPNSFVFRYLYDTHTRSTLRDNRVQRERWGNYTISLLRTANSGLSARVSVLINRTSLS